MPGQGARSPSERCACLRRAVHIRMRQAKYRSNAIVCSPPAIVNAQPECIAVPSMMLLDERERRGYWLWSAAALAAGLALRLWFILHLPTVAGRQPDLRRHREELVAAWRLRLRPNGRIAGRDRRSSHSDSPSRLPAFSRGLLPPLRHGELPRRNVRAGRCRPAYLLAGKRTGWPPLRPSRGAGCIVARRALPLHRELRCCAAHRDTGAHDYRAGILRVRALAGSGDGLQPLAVGGCAALAYSILLRPDQGLLAAAIVPAMLWRALAARSGRESMLRAASPVLAMALCAVLPLAPWTLRNWRTFHVFQPLAPRYANDPGERAPRGFARWYRTWAIDFASTDEVYWNYDGDPIQLERPAGARLPRRLATSRRRPPRTHRSAARRLQRHHHSNACDQCPLRCTWRRA